jgi:hypothetical protein
MVCASESSVIPRSDRTIRNSFDSKGLTVMKSSGTQFFPVHPSYSEAKEIRNPFLNNHLRCTPCPGSARTLRMHYRNPSSGFPAHHALQQSSHSSESPTHRAASCASPFTICESGFASSGRVPPARLAARYRGRGFQRARDLACCRRERLHTIYRASGRLRISPCRDCG